MLLPVAIGPYFQLSRCVLLVVTVARLRYVALDVGCFLRIQWCTCEPDL